MALSTSNVRDLPPSPPYERHAQDPLWPKPEDEDQNEIPHTLSHIATAPPVLPSEPPPEYAPLDALARVFSLRGSLIYTTQTSNTPRYQLQQEFTRSGRPRKLHIRRLLLSEARRHSLPTPSSPTPKSPGLQIPYDEDGTMYTITAYEMKGLRESTIRGSIKLETGKGIKGKWCRIYHLTKNKERDYLDPANERRMLKYGYQASEEWNKRLLYSVRGGKWWDGEGRVVANENGGGKNGSEDEKGFGIEDVVDARKRDLLVSCWAMRVWMCDGIRWEGDWLGR